MGKIDNVLNDYVAEPKRFAQITNYGIFNGKQIVNPTKLKEMDSASRKKNTAGKIRDVVKLYDDKACYIIIGIENQNKVNYLMPLRVLDYNIRTYEKERLDISRLHHENEDLKTPEELLSGFSKEDRLTPVITLVVYYGDKPWDGAKDLHDLLDITEEMEPYRDLIDNHRIHLIEINKMENFDDFSDDLKRVFGFVKYQSDKDALKKYVIENENIFIEIPEEDSSVIRAMADSEILVNNMDSNKEGQVTYMCKAIRDWEETSMKIGEQNFLVKLVNKKLQKGKSVEEIADALEMNVEDIRIICLLQEAK